MPIRFRFRAAAAIVAACALLGTGAVRAADDADPTAAASFWYGTLPDGKPTVRLYFFWDPQCPHCQAALPFIDDLPRRLPWVVIISRPIRDDRPNAHMYYDTARAVGMEASSVPGFFYCRTGQIGFASVETTGEALVRELQQCREKIMREGAK